jgi:hypothetical protein
MSTNGTKNICFYSNKDKWSKAFIEELSKTAWIRDFEFICVDASPNRPPLPSWLKQVPTLVINGDKDPIKTDTEVIYERKMMEKPQKKQNAPSAAPSALGGEPESWIGNEMGGMGDSGYSFVDSDTSTGGNGGSSIPGTFGFLNGVASTGDRQSQLNGGGASAAAGGRKTKKEQLLDDQLDLYKQSRDVGIRQPQVRQ